MIVWMLWSVLFAVLVGLAAIALERVAAHFGVARRFVWMTAVVASTAVPVFLASQRVRISRPATVASPGFSSTPRPSIVDMNELPSPVERTVQQAAVANVSADTWAVRVWLVMSVVVFGMFAAAAHAMQRRRNAWIETDLGQCRALVTDDDGPAVIGFVRPRVVIPKWVLTADEPSRNLMVRHELEHVTARDPQALLIAGTALVAFPWNAPLWWMVRRLRVAMELDCDARVIRAVGKAHDYGMVLLAVGERHSTPLPLATSLTGLRPILERRITAMTMPKPRRPILASLPFALVAIVAMTAATTAPRPTSLSAIAAARGPQDYPTRAQVAAMALANIAALSNAGDTSSYAVVVIDANNNFVQATAGWGTCMIQVWADPLDHAARRARSAERVGGAAGGAAGASGRGGRGGGATGSAAGGIATGSFVATTGTRPQNAYMGGPAIMNMNIDPATGERHVIPVNNAPGLHAPEKGAPLVDDSHIDGIPASRLTSMETFTFSDGELAGHRRISVVVVTTNTIGPVR